MLTAKKIRSKLKRMDPLRQREFMHRRSAKREMCNRIKELVVGDILLGVDEFNGQFYIDPRSDLSLRLLADGFFEPELARLAAHLTDPERDVIDVGANIGFYTILLAKRLSAGNRVAAFEPSKEAFEKLMKNVAHNQVEEKVLSFPLGASDSTGSSALYHVQGRTEYSSFVPIVHPAASSDFISVQSISTVTVDEVVSNHELRPAFLKVDVEGAEHLVIAGSRRTIRSYRPVILMEISDQLLQSAGSSAQAVVEDIRSYDYVVIDPVKPRLQPGIRAFGDIVCFPKEDGRWRYISGTSLDRAK